MYRNCGTKTIRSSKNSYGLIDFRRSLVPSRSFVRDYPFPVPYPNIWLSGNECAGQAQSIIHYFEHPRSRGRPGQCPATHRGTLFTQRVTIDIGMHSFDWPFLLGFILFDECASSFNAFSASITPV